MNNSEPWKNGEYWTSFVFWIVNLIWIMPGDIYIIMNNESPLKKWFSYKMVIN